MPLFLTCLLFAAVFDIGRRWVVAPIDTVIYGALEQTRPGWRVLGWLGVDPYDDAFLDYERLIPRLHALGMSDGYESSALRRALREDRGRHEGFVRNLEALHIRVGAGPEVGLRDAVETKVPPVVGLGVCLLLVAATGRFVAHPSGRGAMDRLEELLGRVPLIRSVYPSSKRFVEFFVTDAELQFDTVVAIPYPSDGLWTVAFVTSRSMRTLHTATGSDLVSVFVPSTPMPMSGYTIHIPMSRVVPLSISVENAIRVIVSGGVLVPNEEWAGSIPDQLRSVARGQGIPEPAEGCHSPTQPPSERREAS